MCACFCGHLLPTGTYYPRQCYSHATRDFSVTCIIPAARLDSFCQPVGSIATLHCPAGAYCLAVCCGTVSGGAVVVAIFNVSTVLWRQSTVPTVPVSPVSPVSTVPTVFPDSDPTGFRSRSSSRNASAECTASVMSNTVPPSSVGSPKQSDGFPTLKNSQLHKRLPKRCQANMAESRRRNTKAWPSRATPTPMQPRHDQAEGMLRAGSRRGVGFEQRSALRPEWPTR